MASLIIGSSGKLLSRPNDGDVVFNPGIGQLLTISFLTITTPDGNYEVVFLPGIVDLYQESCDRSYYSTNIKEIHIDKGTKLHKVGNINNPKDIVLTYSGTKYRVSKEKLDCAKLDSLIICNDGIIRTRQDTFRSNYDIQEIYSVLHKVDQ